jgi:hypothetical protein
MANLDHSPSGDQRLAHDSGSSVSAEELKNIGVLYWNIPHDDQWEQNIGALDH